MSSNHTKTAEITNNSMKMMRKVHKVNKRKNNKMSK
jgi:hypothetical protein